jgi:hypothetical protein
MKIFNQRYKPKKYQIVVKLNNLMCRRDKITNRNDIFSRKMFLFLGKCLYFKKILFEKV